MLKHCLLPEGKKNLLTSPNCRVPMNPVYPTFVSSQDWLQHNWKVFWWSLKNKNIKSVPLNTRFGLNIEWQCQNSVMYNQRFTAELFYFREQQFSKGNTNVSVPSLITLKTLEVSFSSLNSSCKMSELDSGYFSESEILQILMKLSCEQLTRRRSPPSVK